MTYTITTPVKGQPVSSSLFGAAVKAAINDLDSRVAKLEGTQQFVIKRARRTTTTASISTTETGVLRIDNVPVRAGQIYQMQTGFINLDVDSGTATNMQCRADIRAFYQATSGGVATVANSTSLSYYRMQQPDVTNSNVCTTNAFYVATADGFISILLTLTKQNSATGTFSMFCTAGTPFDLMVQYNGPDPGDTGVVL